jgi:hypothetical protein
MSQDHAGHDHTHGMAKQTLRLAFFLTMLILATELICSWTRSFGLTAMRLNPPVEQKCQY